MLEKNWHRKVSYTDSVTGYKRSVKYYIIEFLSKSMAANSS